MSTYHEVNDYMVDGDVYRIRCFGYPEHNEIDFEIINAQGQYVATITSNRPDLSTSVVYRWLKGIPADCITYVVKGDSL